MPFPTTESNSLDYIGPRLSQPRTMSFFKRASKPNQAANPPLDGSNQAMPQPDANPAASLGDDDAAQNAMELARTRTEDIVYPSGLKLVFLMLSTFVSMFLVALVCNSCCFSRLSPAQLSP